MIEITEFIFNFFLKIFKQVLDMLRLRTERQSKSPHKQVIKLNCGELKKER